MNYPEKFIRGISNPEFVDADGRASLEIFQFQDMNREDGFSELSINWYDNEKALRLIMEQRKDEQTFQFKCGAAIVARGEADRIKKNPLYKDIFGYERSPIDGNQYHGNLLRKDKLITKKSIKTIIAANLAMNAQIIFREPAKAN
jgi:hypothetical protein